MIDKESSDSIEGDVTARSLCIAAERKVEIGNRPMECSQMAAEPHRWCSLQRAQWSYVDAVVAVSCIVGFISAETPFDNRRNAQRTSWTTSTRAQSW